MTRKFFSLPCLLLGVVFVLGSQCTRADVDPLGDKGENGYTVFDDAGATLGTLTTTNDNNLVGFISSKGYFFKLFWDGTEWIPELYGNEQIAGTQVPLEEHLFMAAYDDGLLPSASTPMIPPKLLEKRCVVFTSSSSNITESFFCHEEESPVFPHPIDDLNLNDHTFTLKNTKGEFTKGQILSKNEYQNAGVHIVKKDPSEVGVVLPIKGPLHVKDQNNQEVLRASFPHTENLFKEGKSS